jgi:hypothetical protein
LLTSTLPDIDYANFQSLLTPPYAWSVHVAGNWESLPFGTAAQAAFDYLAISRQAVVSPVPAIQRTGCSRCVQTESGFYTIKREFIQSNSVYTQQDDV